MSLVDAIKQFIQIIEEAKSLDERKRNKELKKESNKLTKDLKKITKVTVDDIFQMQNLLESIEINTLLDEEWLSSILKEIDAVKKRHSVVFMDANATLVHAHFHITPCSEEEQIWFKINLRGTPVVQEWRLMLEQTREVSDVYLPPLTYEGYAKLCPHLLYFDWIEGRRDTYLAYLVGPTGVFRPPSIIPLSMIHGLKVPSEDSKFDFDFMILSSREFSKERLRDFRKKNETLDYHQLPDFLFRAKVERFKGESKDDQEQMRAEIIDFLRQHTNDVPVDIGWSVAYTRFLGTGFPPIGRGMLIPYGFEPPSVPPIPEGYLPMTFDGYLMAVKDKFDEDNIVPQEGVIDSIPIIYGSRWVAHERNIPIMDAPGRVVNSKNWLTSHCFTVLGFQPSVSLENIKSFSKLSAAFVKDKAMKGTSQNFVIPVLITNEVASDVREWVEWKIEDFSKVRSVPAILDLANGVLYYTKQWFFKGDIVNKNAQMFIDRYLIMEWMRGRDRILPSTSMLTRCPSCGAQYSAKKGEIEVTCQNCLKVYSVSSESE